MYSAAGEEAETVNCPKGSGSSSSSSAPPTSPNLAGTRDATELEALFSLLEHVALPLLLQHHSICRSQKLVCKLLCVSKAMQAAVALQCAGQLMLRIALPDADSAEKFCPWLAKHAGLIKGINLHLDYGSNNPKESAAEAAAAAALQQAAAVGAGGLQFESFSADPASHSIDVLLQQLPSSSLTSLNLVFQEEIPHTEPAAAAAVAAALARLTALTWLNLELGGDAILSCCSSLTNLKELTVRPVDAVNELRHVPPQLQQLEFAASRKQREQQEEFQHQPWLSEFLPEQTQQQLLQLGHVTALSALSTMGMYGERGQFHVMENDVLPPNVLYIEVRDVPLVKPLLQLQQLQVLHMINSTTPAAQLLQLSSLQQLTDVSLGYIGRYTDRGTSIPTVDAAAAAWPSLPLSSLTVRGDGEDGRSRMSGQVMSAASVHQLGRLQGLTQLELSDIERFGATAEELAAALKPLNRLRSLRLGGKSMLRRPDSGIGHGAAAGSSNSSSDDDDEYIERYYAEEKYYAEDTPAEVEWEQMQVVFSSVGAMSGLRSLSVSNWLMDRVVSSNVLDGLRYNLVNLELEKAALCDEHVLAIAVKFTRLKGLNLDGNIMLTEAVLPGLLQLQQLDSLSVQGTQITEEAADRWGRDMAWSVQAGQGYPEDLPKKMKDLIIAHNIDRVEELINSE